MRKEFFFSIIYFNFVSGMVQSLDNSVGRIVTTLAEKDILKDTIIVFVSDNGGAPTDIVYRRNYGVNLPLRGVKSSPWEGGTRVPAFIWHASLQPGFFKGIYHVTDWLPTFLSATGSQPAHGIDGIDQWKSLQEGCLSERREFLVVVDDFKGYAAYRYGDYKIVIGTSDDKDNYFYGNELLRNKTEEPSYEKAIMSCEIGNILNSLSKTPLTMSIINNKRNNAIIPQESIGANQTFCVPSPGKYVPLEFIAFTLFFTLYIGIYIKVNICMYVDRMKEPTEPISSIRLRCNFGELFWTRSKILSLISPLLGGV